MSTAGRSRWPAAVLAVAGAVMVAVCTSCGRGSPSGEITAESVAVDSEGVAISVRDFTVRPDGERLDWSFALVCDQPEGCRGAVRLEVRYRSRGEARMFSATREVDLETGGEVRFGRTGPLEKVDGVDRVRVALVARPSAGSTPPGGPPRPTPRV
jgi:hypothetical protein